MDSDGANLPPEKARDLERILNSGEYKCVPAEEIGELQPFDSAAEIYEKHISSVIRGRRRRQGPDNRGK